MKTQVIIIREEENYIGFSTSYKNHTPIVFSHDPMWKFEYAMSPTLYKIINIEKMFEEGEITFFEHSPEIRVEYQNECFEFDVAYTSKRITLDDPDGDNPFDITVVGHIEALSLRRNFSDNRAYIRISESVNRSIVDVILKHER